MRIEQVRIAGVGPFRAEQVVDFTAYARDGLFLMAGKTGSGKSSILDAIVYALYDRLPRYDAGADRAIRSDHAAPHEASWVEVVFELPRGRYRIWRAPEYERPKARGEGTTLAKANARLDVWDESMTGDDKWTTIAAKPRDVGLELADLLPLSGDQFLQVVLLAQNRFHEFLVADSADRTKLLRALFSTHRFAELADRVDDRRKLAAEALERAQVKVAAHRSRHADLDDDVARIESELAGPDAPRDAGADARRAFAPTGARSAHGTIADSTAVPGDPLAAAVDAAAAASEHQAAAVDEAAEPSTTAHVPATAGAPELGLAISATTTRATRAAATADIRSSQADATLQATEEALAEATATELRQRRRDAAASRLRHLDERCEATDAKRVRLAVARAVSPVMPLVSALDDAGRSLDDATRAAIRATLADATLGADTGVGDQRRASNDADVDVDVMHVTTEAHPLHPSNLAATTRKASDRAEAATARLGALEPAAEHERSRPGIARSLERATQMVSERLASIEALTTELELLPAVRAEHESVRAEQSAVAATLARTTADLEAATAGRAAARRAASVAGDLAAATATRDAANAALEAADAREADLLRARIDHAAGLLAEKLTPGSPCQVCGSSMHPKPATARPLDDVSNEALQRAAAAVGDARARLAGRQRAVEEIDATLREAKIAAGPRSLGEHDAAVAAADAAHQRATMAVDLRDAADAAIAAVDARIAGAQQQIDAAKEQLTEARIEVGRRTTEVESLDAELTDARGKHESVAVALTSTAAARDRARAAVATLDRLAAARDTLTLSRQRLDEALRTADSDLEPFRALPDIEDPAWNRRVAALNSFAMAPAAIAETEADIRDFDDGVAAATAQLADPELHGLPTQSVDVASHESARSTASAARDAARGLLRDANRSVGDLTKLRTLAAVDVDALANANQHHRRLRALSGTLRGTEPNEMRMSLEAFVLAAQMEEIVDAANQRLALMSSGRYQLEHDDSLRKGRGASGLGLRILDAYTGRSRPTRSLSGGETFLASLALALGLSDTVTAQAGGVRLDTLFIDEGFGSLDSDTLEVAMATLDSLRAGGRTVGVISHVETMHEQIPARLEVRVTDSGDSVIEQHTASTGAGSQRAAVLSAGRAQ